MQHIVSFCSAFLKKFKKINKVPTLKVEEFIAGKSLPTRLTVISPSSIFPG